MYNDDKFDEGTNNMNGDAGTEQNNDRNYDNSTENQASDTNWTSDTRNQSEQEDSSNTSVNNDSVTFDNADTYTGTSDAQNASTDSQAQQTEAGVSNDAFNQYDPFAQNGQNNGPAQNNPFGHTNPYGQNNQPGGGNNLNGGKKNNSWKKFAAGAALVASVLLVGGAGAYTIGGVLDQFQSSSSHSGSSANSSETPDLNSNDSSDSLASTSTDGEITDESVSQVVENVMPAIVSINSTVTETVQDMFGRTYEQEGTSAGSGIIIGQNSSEVLIVTNNHVIESADNGSVEVVFCDEETVSATIKGTDSSSDLAVIAVSFADIKDSTKKEIKVATIGDSDSTKVGETAIAIGNALGYGQSVTVGHVSALDREMEVEDSSMTLMQTDAAINPGNSGGALLNAKGEVIGINSAKTATTEVEGMGYAIPISDALPIINDLMEGKTASENDAAYLGIIGENIDSSYASRFNMPEGVYITQVAEGSPAEDGGLVAGMIIYEIDGNEVTTKDDLTNVLGSETAGTTVKIGVYVNSNGKYTKQEVSVTLGNKSDYTDDSSSSEDGSTDGGSTDDGSTDDGSGVYGYGSGSDGSSGSDGYSFGTN